MKPKPKFVSEAGAGDEKKITGAGAEEKWLGSTTLVCSVVVFRK